VLRLKGDDPENHDEVPSHHGDRVAPGESDKVRDVLLDKVLPPPRHSLERVGRVPADLGTRIIQGGDQVLDQLRLAEGKSGDLGSEAVRIEPTLRQPGGEVRGSLKLIGLGSAPAAPSRVRGQAGTISWLRLSTTTGHS
jgi:hypothetical protein